MERTVKQVRFRNLAVPKLKRVAAYARVSIDKDAMRRSLAAQVSRYSDMIQSHAGWRYMGVYADYAKTGTKDNREEFNRLLADCHAGQIDMIITKSISRFARNTVTLLETIRDLKELGVDVFFEEQNIHTLSDDGELMLTLLASFAQEEARSMSENVKWRVRNSFIEGKPWCGAMLGYRMKNGKYEIVPDEAEVVRRIFTEYLNGSGIDKITNGLNKDGILTRKGYSWHRFVVGRTLKNYAYTGNLILQTTYSENYITKRPKKNNGELPMYHVADSHEPIISEQTYNAVQAEMKRRAEKYKPCRPQFTPYPYTGLIACGICGKHYRRKSTASGPVWICNTYNSQGKKACPSKRIPESTLNELCSNFDLENIVHITAYNDNRLVFLFDDGSEIEKIWENCSRSESWTEEMKQKARERRLSHA